MAVDNKKLIAHQMVGHLYIEVAKIYGIPEALFDGIVPVRPELAWEGQETAAEKILQDIDKSLREHPEKAVGLKIDPIVNHLAKNALVHENTAALEHWMNHPGFKPEPDWEIQALLACTNQQWGPGLERIATHAKRNRSPARLVISAKEAKLWADTNTETASARIRAMRKVHPDFNPSSPEWGKIFLQELKKENLISAWAKEDKTNPSEDKTITIVGEIHGHPSSAKKEIALIREAAKAGTAILSLEEPRDLDWEPILKFLATIPKDTAPEEVETLGLLKGLPAKTASRISVVYTAKVLGLEIALVDAPRAQKLQEQKRLEKETLRRIAYGEPFDKTKPISAVGGSKCLAENLRASYEASRPRSKAMAEALLALQSTGRKILHIGGKLHTQDIALTIQERTGRKPITKQLSYPKENPLILTILGESPRKDLTQRSPEPDNLSPP